MISVDLARALRDAGLRWRPEAGDRFTIEQPELVGEVFTLSEMTIEARTYPTGTILGFNGTTEWALDSVTLEETLWLPSEAQLRELLGTSFRSLRRDDGEYVVAVAAAGPDDTAPAHDEHRAASATDAYALAVLDLVRRATS